MTNSASDDVSDNDVEVQLILDTERNHYQWMNVGWQGFNRIYRCVMHFDIKDGKIWLQQNLTDRNPAEELVMMGVYRLGFASSIQASVYRLWRSVMRSTCDADNTNDQPLSV